MMRAKRGEERTWELRREETMKKGRREGERRDDGS